MSVIIRPIISEKANNETEKRNKYSFYVKPKANKIEIKTAIEKSFGVNVISVQTMVYAPDVKKKNTKSGPQIGKTNKMKKAIVSVTEGQTIDIYGN